jgi:rod shape-determining protein MreD
MRLLKIALYILVILVLQTVVFSRLSFFGAAPDLVLVSVVIFSIRNEREKSSLFAAGSALLQDILSFGIYINTILKLVVSSVIGVLKEGLVSEESTLAAGFVLAFTPLTLFLKAGVSSFFFGGRFDLYHLLFIIFFSSLYNLIMIPVLLPVLKRLDHD